LDSARSRRNSNVSPVERCVRSSKVIRLKLIALEFGAGQFRVFRAAFRCIFCRPQKIPRFNRRHRIRPMNTRQDCTPALRALGPFKPTCAAFVAPKRQGLKRLLRTPSAASLIATGALFAFSSGAEAQVLGTAESFGVLAGSTVTNTGPSVITGNVGVSPGSAVVGFPPGIVVGGTIHAADGVANQAQSDLVTAYNTLQALPSQVDLTGQDLGGAKPGARRL
jgi:hypothetical protein